jgi:hypothetical protein
VLSNNDGRAVARSAVMWNLFVRQLWSTLQVVTHSINSS